MFKGVLKFSIALLFLILFRLLHLDVGDGTEHARNNRLLCDFVTRSKKQRHKMFMNHSGGGGGGGGGAGDHQRETLPLRQGI